MATYKYWEVVGGGDNGGIVVREGKALTSKQAAERLATRSIVLEVEVVEGRLHYERQDGQGPEFGWVSLTLKDQALLLRANGPRSVETPKEMLTMDQARQAQRILQREASRPDIQKKLDAFEAASGGDFKKYSSRLKGLLISEIYPNLAKHFGFTDAMQASSMIFVSLGMHCSTSMEMTETWLKLEQTLRNKESVLQAERMLEKFREGTGIGDEVLEYAEGDDNDEECCILSLSGEVIGSVYNGRILGGCKANGCNQFRPSKLPWLCRRCGKANTEHEDKGPFETEEEDVEEGHNEVEGAIASVSAQTEEKKEIAEFTVRIKCQKVPSGCDIMHMKVTAGIIVADLRDICKDFLPPTARVFSATQPTLQPLTNSQLVPPKIAVSEVVKTIQPVQMLTLDLAKEAQQMMLTEWRKREMQTKLDELEEAASWNERKYVTEVKKMVMTIVLPKICSHFDLPENCGPYVSLAIMQHSFADVVMLENWLKLETLMRNKESIKQAQQVVHDAHENMARVGA